MYNESNQNAVYHRVFPNNHLQFLVQYNYARSFTFVYVLLICIAKYWVILEQFSSSIYAFLLTILNYRDSDLAGEDSAAARDRYEMRIK